jgi:hypothetical protein
MAENCSEPFYVQSDNLAIQVIWDNPSLGPIPFVGTPTDPETVGQTIFAEAEAGDYGPVVSYADSHRWYSTVDPVGGLLVTPTGVQPANTTLLVPPTPAAGQTLQWSGSAWVLASFDITLSLPAAKTDLINQTNTDSAAAVVVQLSAYSPVQQATAPDITLLNTLDYPGIDIGTYQTYVDAISAAEIATINSATDISELYPLNPSALPFTPAVSGLLSTGRGAAPEGDLDLNPSYYTEFNSTTLTEAETELYIPGTSTVITYGVPIPGEFDSAGNCFDFGDYLVQIRQVATGFVLAEFICPLSPTNVDVAF